ncbi:hypothetical protein KSP40_PGU006140 [Platanthera guangdongensis]|uniref:Uncharacterized protein n=1 Tax=Platanthera guangdongensis TaxID=2320717 RepID=A0ABR2MX06_9ASPA
MTTIELYTLCALAGSKGPVRNPSVKAELSWRARTRLCRPLLEKIFGGMYSSSYRRRSTRKAPTLIQPENIFGSGAPSSEALQPNLEKFDPETPPLASTGPSSIPTSTADSPSSATLAAAAPIEIPTTNQPNQRPILYSNPVTDLNRTPAIIPPPTPPAAPSFTPSYRLFGAPSAPQYTTVPNPNIQPPGVSAPMLSVNPMISGTMYTAPPGMPPYGSNGYMSAPVHAQHAFPPPGGFFL